MAIMKFYLLEVAADKGGETLAALHALSAALADIPGCESSEVLRDRDVPQRLSFIERWISPEAYRAGGQSVPKELFARLMATLAGKPAAFTFDVVA
jgi:quinol monooxygenase YgiN